jgi:AbiJ N-terminal domain 4
VTFSERHGFTTPRSAFQKDDLDAATRNRLINVVITFCLTRDLIPYELDGNAKWIFGELINLFFKQSLDKATDRYDPASKMLIAWASKCKWYSLMDLLEFIAARDDFFESRDRRKWFVQECKLVFEEEKVAYRFVRNKITSIMEDTEIEAIEQALGSGDLFLGVKQHLGRALELFSDRKNPDYRNTIKEAISAVESVSRIVSGKKKATLGDAIKVIEKKHGMHPALKDALLKLYGYSSDKGGIRHSLLEDASIGAAEAKLMLVGCSAFCNYMIEQYGLVGDASGKRGS